MNSFTLMFKTLKVLSKPLLRSEVIGVYMCTGSNRTLCSNNAIFSSSIYKKHINKTDLESDEGNSFGKVIELCDDFEEVKLESGPKSKKGRKSSKSNSEDPYSEEYPDGKKISKSIKSINDSRGSSGQLKKHSKVSSLERNASLFRSVMIQVKSKKSREKHNEIVLEGKRIIQTAIASGFMPKKIFYSRNEDLEALSLPPGLDVFRIPYKSFETWSEVETPQGICGVFEKPDSSNFKVKTESLPVTVICDNVRDPANLGSILRVVAGAGCRKLLLTKGCVDIWEPKVLRSSAGSHFHLPIVNKLLWSDIKMEIDEHSKVILSDLSAASSSQNEEAAESQLNVFRRQSCFSDNLPEYSYYSVKYTDEDIVLILGGETFGISDMAYELASEYKGSKIFIPMCEHVESLNNAVALGVILFEIKRQFDLSKIECNLSAANLES